MNDDTQDAVVARIAELESRLGQVERSESRGGQGWTAKFGRAGIIVSCLTGVLGGIGASLALWHQLVVRNPEVQLVGDNIEAHWDSQSRRLSFDCWFTANNSGGTTDRLRTVGARLTTSKGVTVWFKDIAVKRSADSPRSFLIRHDGHPIDGEVTVASLLDDQIERTFYEGGLHILALDFETPLSRVTQTMTYCVWFGAESWGDLVKNGSLAIAKRRDDPRCDGN